MERPLIKNLVLSLSSPALFALKNESAKPNVTPRNTRKTIDRPSKRAAKVATFYYSSTYIGKFINLK